MAAVISAVLSLYFLIALLGVVLFIIILIPKMLVFIFKYCTSVSYRERYRQLRRKAQSGTALMYDPFDIF